MSRRILLSIFRDEKNLKNAVRAVRARDAVIVDVYSPYAVHGLDEALGWRPSRLTWACALGGGATAAAMLWFQLWASAVDWPLNIGGKPYNSLPAFVPVTFEAMVLGGALCTVLAFFAVARLWPGKRRSAIYPGVHDDRFALLIEQTDAAFDVEQMSALLREHQAEQVEQRVIEQCPDAADHDPDACPALIWLNRGLAAVFVIAVLAVLYLPRDPLRPNWEYMPTMRRAVPVEAQTALAGLPYTRPIPGTLARDAHPLAYQATPEDAQRAGQELTNPFAADDAAALERGRTVFLNFCTSCHGAGGEGDGPIALRGYPPPPPLSGEKTKVLKDGELFHVISYGRNNMPASRFQLSQDDRWRLVLHVRDLQRRAAQQAAQPAPAQSSEPADAVAPNPPAEPPVQAPTKSEPAQPASATTAKTDASSPQTDQPKEAVAPEAEPQKAEPQKAEPQKAEAKEDRSKEAAPKDVPPSEAVPPETSSTPAADAQSTTGLPRRETSKAAPLGVAAGLVRAASLVTTA